jgi:hypothetical protein
MTNFRLCAAGAAAMVLSAQSAAAACADPVGAVLATMDCIMAEDATCASNGYARGFKKIHNSVPEEGLVMSEEYWSNAFKLVDLELTFDRQLLLDPSTVSLRYVEKVTTTDGSEFGAPASTRYPFSQTLTQHEHALVTVDNDCKIAQWSQTGDNVEQFAVTTIENQALCALEILSGPACEN